MALPIRTTIDDIREVCRYFATKPTGATVSEAKAVLDPKRLDGRKLTALKFWLLIDEQEDGKLKLTPDGRRLAKGGEDEREVLLSVIRRVPAYSAIIERAAHRHEDSLDTTEVAAHWYDHFRNDVSSNDKILNDEAVCFFHVAAGASLGTVIAGRKGKATRFSFLAEALRAYISGGVTPMATESTTVAVEADTEEIAGEDSTTHAPLAPEQPTITTLGQGIFIAHGKNKKPLDQLKKILDEFHITYKVAVDEPNLGRPISGKIREIMHACNCAILIFTADEEFRDLSGNTIWRPSENVVYELGAAAFLYDNRIVILKEAGVTFPSNFSDLGHISFEKDQLDAKAMEVFKELVGFRILKIST